MQWDFSICTVQQTETTMWKSTGRTSNQVMSVFAHITKIINMHQFPVHTERTNILHSLHTTVTIMYSSNGCTSKVLVLQKIFWTNFGTEFTAILNTSINFNLSNNNSSLNPVRTPHTFTSRRFYNMPCNNYGNSYVSRILQHITLHKTFPDTAAIWTYLMYVSRHLYRHIYCHL